MNKKEIQKIYHKKIKKINDYNKLYYNESNPGISDSDYDKFKKEIILLENKYDFLKSDASPSKAIGFKPSKNFAKFQHRVPMLSLSNAFTEEDLLNFEKKNLNFLSENHEFKIFYSAEPKIDGISASLTYLNGNLTYGVSRGDGNEGELITNNLKTIKDIPHKILKKKYH